MVVCGLIIWEPLNKCQFIDILYEDYMNFTAVVENDNMKYLHFTIP